MNIAGGAIEHSATPKTRIFFTLRLIEALDASEKSLDDPPDTLFVKSQVSSLKSRHIIEHLYHYIHFFSKNIRRFLTKSEMKVSTWKQIMTKFGVK